MILEEMEVPSNVIVIEEVDEEEGVEKVKVEIRAQQFVFRKQKLQGQNLNLNNKYFSKNIYFFRQIFKSCKVKFGRKNKRGTLLKYHEAFIIKVTPPHIVLNKIVFKKL